MSNSDEQILAQLRLQVDALVNPLRAGPARKSIMREELLAHLIGIYDDESNTPESSSSALTATRRRFGDSAALSRQLQASVPFLERVFSMIYNKEHTMKRFWLTLLLTGLAGLAFGLALVLPALAKLKLDGALPGGPITFLVLGVVIMMFGAQALCWGIARRIRKPV
jgi:hypothetical protein